MAPDTVWNHPRPENETELRADAARWQCEPGPVSYSTSPLTVRPGDRTGRTTPREASPLAINPEEFGASFKDFLDQMRTQKKPGDAPFFTRTLREHFAAEPAVLPIVSESFPPNEHPNIHLALEAYTASDGRRADVLGVGGTGGFRDKGLSDLVAPASGFGGAADQGPVQYANVTLDGDRVLACVARGLFLVRDGEHRLAIYVRPEDKIGAHDHIVVEVMAADREIAERGLRDLRSAMRERNVYRGHVISLREEGFHDLKVKFHGLPAIDRDAIILPQGLLERIERQTLGFGRQSQRLRAAGRHLKRGLLLHGAPGTGKTLTLMYLAAAMRDRTVLLMTGRNLGLIGRTCAMARVLQPSIVVLEDVDLVAEERTKGGSGCATPLLFELLNEMDGLSDDVDTLFLLTTNRPELLEPALASRPGRVDQAIEIPLPDAACRHRLFTLYGQGLTLRVSDLSGFIRRTEGASAAFIRELLRRAALFAADAEGDLVVTDAHLDAALHDLVVTGGELTKSLLGFRSRIGFDVRSASPAGDG